MTVDRAIREALADWGDHPCYLEPRLSGDAIRASAREVSERIGELSRQLSLWGIRRRHVVAVFLANSTDFVCVFAALLRLDAVPVLVKMDYRRLELEEIFGNAQPGAVICEELHLGVLRPFLSGPVTVVTRGAPGFTLLQSGDGLPFRQDLPEEVASINYTYRGLGYPLGAMVTHEQYLHGARVLQDGLQGRKGDRMLVVLPMAHIFTLVGCVLVPLLYRMTSALGSSLHPRRVFDCIRDLRIDHVTTVPEVLEMLHRVHDPAAELGSLQTFVSGGSVLTATSWDAIRKRFSVDILHGYGLTEFTPVSRNIRGRSRGGTVGPVCDGVECRVFEADADGVGEIQVRARNIGGTYYRRPAESAQATMDGWFRTGDLGRLDEGHLVFCRELKGTRKVNGNIVDLAEVERAFRCDPDVAQVDLLWKNNDLSARIAMRRGVDRDAKRGSLRDTLRALLAPHKIPREIALL